MAVCEIIKFENDLLRKQSKAVKKFDDEIENIINNMIDTMINNQGVGLAANQIGILKRIIIFQVKQNDKEEIIPLINPTIVKYIGSEILPEGCLSFPDWIADINRATKIIVKGQQKNRKKIKFIAEGLPARIIQHEIDHLNGILIIDRAEPGTFRKIEKVGEKKEVIDV